MPNEPNDAAYLLDMLVAARKVEAFTRGMTEGEFLRDEKLQLAVARLPEIVGEAARNVSTEFQRDHTEIDWAGIVGMRNRLIHDYGAIKQERVWAVVAQHISPLIASLESEVPSQTGAARR